MSHYDVAHLYTQPMSLPSFNFWHLTPFEDKAWKYFQTQGHYSNIKSISHTMTLQTYTWQLPTPWQFKSRSRHDAVHLPPSTNIPTRLQLPTPYGFRDTANIFLLPASAPTQTP